MKLPPPVRFGRPRPDEKDVLEGDRLFTEAYAELERDFWLKKSEWTLEEAVAISFGRDPRYVNWSAVEPYSSSSRYAYEYYKRREIVLSARNQGHLPDPIASTHFVRWALWIDLPCAVADYDLADPRLPSMASTAMSQSTAGIQVDPLQTNRSIKDLLARAETQLEQSKARVQELEARVQQLEQELADAQEQRPMKAPERSALTMLVYAMARSAYGYDPARLKNEATSKILRALNRFELSLDEKTIRRHLKQANSEVQKLKPWKNPD